MVKCSNCGGVFERTLSECPYCGQINFLGAEDEYKEKLENVRSELDDLSDIHFSEYKSEIKRQTKGAGKVIAVILGVILFFLGIVLIGRYTVFKPKSSDDIKAQMAWEREVFPTLDTLYEEEKFEELFEFYNDTIIDTDYNIYAWEHIDFVIDYGYYYDYKYSQECIENGDKITEHNLGFMVYYILHFTHDIDYKYYEDDETAYFDTYIEEMLHYLESIIDIDSVEFDKIYELATKKGFLDVGKVIDYMEKNLERVKL